jgi:GNAT superfamily N-acetyltransferase
MFKIVDVASGAGVGSVGFWTKEWRDERVYEVGWMVVPEFQGHGIAVAATAQAIELAKRQDKHRRGDPRLAARRYGREIAMSAWARYALRRRPRRSASSGAGTRRSACARLSTSRSSTLPASRARAQRTPKRQRRVENPLGFQHQRRLLQRQQLGFRLRH